MTSTVIIKTEKVVEPVVESHVEADHDQADSSHEERVERAKNPAQRDVKETSPGDVITPEERTSPPLQKVKATSQKSTAKRISKKLKRQIRKFSSKRRQVAIAHDIDDNGNESLEYKFLPFKRQRRIAPISNLTPKSDSTLDQSVIAIKKEPEIPMPSVVETDTAESNAEMLSAVDKLPSPSNPSPEQEASTEHAIPSENGVHNALSRSPLMCSFDRKSKASPLLIVDVVTPAKQAIPNENEDRTAINCSQPIHRESNNSPILIVDVVENQSSTNSSEFMPTEEDETHNLKPCWVNLVRVDPSKLHKILGSRMPKPKIITKSGRTMKPKVRLDPSTEPHRRNSKSVKTPKSAGKSEKSSKPESGKSKSHKIKDKEKIVKLNKDGSVRKKFGPHRRRQMKVKDETVKSLSTSFMELQMPEGGLPEDIVEDYVDYSTGSAGLSCDHRKLL